MQLLRHKAYEYVRHRIASGRLPCGTQLSETALAKEIGIGRMPVREALRQLHVEGLVEQVPRFGTVVRSPEQGEIVELHEIREAIESYAASQAAESMDRDEIGKLRQHVAEMRSIARRFKHSGRQSLGGASLARFLAEDLAFHNLLLQSAGNQRMTRIISDLRVLVRVFALRREQHTPAVLARTCLAHWRIYRAVWARDTEAARFWMAQHIRTTRDRNLEAAGDPANGRSDTGGSREHSDREEFGNDRDIERTGSELMPIH